MPDAPKLPTYDPHFTQLLNTALANKRAGKKLKREEQRAIAKFQSDQDEASRRQHYAAVPKKDYVRLSGRQHKVLDEQAILYDLPIDGPEIDLGRVLRRFHDILAAHGDQLRADEAGPPSSKELLEQERLRKARLENDLAEAHAYPQALVHAVHQLIAARLRLAGEQLQKGFGQGALDIHLDALSDIQASIDQLPQPKASDGKASEE